MKEVEIGRGEKRSQSKKLAGGRVEIRLSNERLGWRYTGNKGQRNLLGGYIVSLRHVADIGTLVAQNWG